MDVTPVEGDFEFIKADITRLESVRRVVRGVDAVVHLAAIIPPKSEEDREETMKVNTEATRNLVMAIEERG